MKMLGQIEGTGILLSVAFLLRLIIFAHAEPIFTYLLVGCRYFCLALAHVLSLLSISVCLMLQRERLSKIQK